jgi:hypothetical protein
MQGQENQQRDDLQGTGSFPSLNGTSKHRILQNPNEGTSKHQAIKAQISQRTSEMRAIPKRPSNMARVDTPPEIPRAPRPQNEVVPKQLLHKRLIIGGSVFAVLAIIGGIIGILIANGIANSSGPAAAATNFLAAVNTQNYTQAYQDLGPAITIRMSQAEFINQAKSIDKYDGISKDYSEVPGCATVSNDNQTYTYIYNITRSKLSKPYMLQLSLQKDSEDNTWKVIDYGVTLGPATPAPTCKK